MKKELLAQAAPGLEALFANKSKLAVKAVLTRFQQFRSSEVQKFRSSASLQPFRPRC
ncbi:MAG: hypothetical protein KAY08_01430 [Giesbergeria sp.]|nr:hypothetical protein [Giesbergeria sp.]MBP8091475.1 hypothetical protein [Giesbergeria sp.]